MTRIPVNPKLPTCSRRHVGVDALALAWRFPKLIFGELHAADAEAFIERAL